MLTPHRQNRPWRRIGLTLTLRRTVVGVLPNEEGRRAVELSLRRRVGNSAEFGQQALDRLHGLIDRGTADNRAFACS